MLTATPFDWAGLQVIGLVRGGKHGGSQAGMVLRDPAGSRKTE